MTTQQDAKKGKLATLFEDLSIAQVIAGALAAATVFLLSSVIGVAGSLIGAAVGSVVSAVSSQVYKKMLSASADKIRDVAPGDSLPKEADPQETRVMNPVPSDKTHTIDVSKVDAGVTKVMGTDDVRYAQARGAGATDPAVQRAHVRRKRKARIQRNVLIVSVVSSLVAVVVVAGLIHVFTAGQGIGEKAGPAIVAPAETSHQQSSGSDGSGSSKSSKSSQSSSGASSSDSGNQSGSSSDSSSNNSGSSSSSSGSDSSKSDSSSSKSNGGSSSSGSGSSSSGSGSSDSSSSGGSSSGGSSSGSSSGTSSSGSSSGSGSGSGSSSSSGSSSGSSGSSASGS